MKLLRSEPHLFITVEYYGMLIAVPEDTRHIATDANGDVFAYDVYNRPKAVIKWLTSSKPEMYRGQVDLEGMNWKDTLIALNTEGE